MHAPGYRSTALLLVGWLAAQLDWNRAGEASGDSLGFEKAVGDEKHSISVALSEKAGEPINRVTVRSKTAEFVVAHKECGDLLDVSFGRTGGRQMQQVFPAGKSDLVSLVQEELMRGGPHRVYLRALAKVRDLILDGGRQCRFGLGERKPAVAVAVQDRATARRKLPTTSADSSSTSGPLPTRRCVSPRP